jgi:(4S)-4-hydroxy-5-phosphonooxypentane-2,3-dione isomerase
MLVVLVYVHVKHEYLQAFKEATLENARNSVQEPGVARFDIIQQEDDPTRFVLVEVYRDAEAPARHKETPHYARWRSVAEEMTAEPRSGVRYKSLFPGEEGW